MDTFTFILALLAFVVTGYQEIRFRKMCSSCPYYLEAKEKM